MLSPNGHSWNAREIQPDVVVAPVDAGGLWELGDLAVDTQLAAAMKRIDP
jgi:C-terminal processing protease CtpA/Prc